MDLLFLIGVAIALFVIIVGILLFQQFNAKSGTEKPAQPQHQRGVPLRAQEGVPRRAQIARNQRNRLRQNQQAAAQADVPVAGVAAQQEQGDEAGDQEDGVAVRLPQGSILSDEKMGAKKRAKMEAKEQKRLQREQELQEREKNKALEAKIDAERKAVAEMEAEHERRILEAERLEREGRERKEQEEYMKMKAAFSVEEEGFEEGNEEEKENLLADFIQYIKDNKVVVLEDLATEFKLKTQQAIERIQDLQANGTITGVIDDRGKFIYVSEEELNSVAKFIKQRGRVSIAELAESSNNLINLKPVLAGDSNV